MISGVAVTVVVDNTLIEEGYKFCCVVYSVIEDGA